MAQEYSYFAGEQPQRQRPLPPPPPFARTPTSTVHEGQGTLYETGPQSGYSYASYPPQPSSSASFRDIASAPKSRPYPSYTPASHAPAPPFDPSPGGAYAAPSPPPGAQPPVFTRPATYASYQSSSRVDPEWRESSFISSYGGFSSPPEPAGPSNGSYFAASSVPTVVPTGAQPPYSAYTSSPRPRTSEPPELPPLNLRDHPARLSDDSAQYSLYSLPSDLSPTTSRPLADKPPRPNELSATAHAQVTPPPRSSSSAGSYTRSARRDHTFAYQQWTAEGDGLPSQLALDSLSLQSAATTSAGSTTNQHSPPPRPPRPPAPRQPTILTSPPLETSAVPVHRSHSTNSTWSRAISSPSIPSFTASPSPDISHRPSYATLSPNTSLYASSSFPRADSYEGSGHGSPALNTDGVGAFGGGRPQYLNAALLSDLAVYVKDHVARGPRQKGSIEHYGFTGEDVVSAIRQALPSPANFDRRLALAIARSMQQALWFHEVDWSDSPLRDAPGGHVYAFLEDEIRDGRGASPDDLAGGRHDDPAAELPTGVFVDLTRCYSPYCGQFSTSGYHGACYSYTCPNRRNTGLSRVGSTLSAISAVEIVEEADNWATSVPKSLLDSLSQSEIAYQNQVFELIQGEQKYFEDLQFIETGFVEPLRSAKPPIIPPERLESFLSSVLLNVSEIREHSQAFLLKLRKKQQEGHVVRGIGQIVLAAAVEWGPAYLHFTTNFPMADFLFKEEKAANPRFEELLMDFHKRPEASKRGFDTFHNRATFRGLRYILLLEQILKNTPEGDPDREHLSQAVQVIRQQGADANAGIDATKSRVALKEFGRDLVAKSGTTLDLELSDTSRRFFMAGRIYRRPEGSTFADQFQDGHLILFDNYLVFTKTPRPDRSGHQKYQITRRPVPLDLVQLKTTSFAEPPIPRSSGFHLRSTRSTGIAQATPQPAADGTQLLYPVSYFQLGRFDGLVYFYVDSAGVRDEWEKMLKEAVTQRLRQQELRRVVRLDPLADQTFGTTSTIGSLSGASGAPNQFGRPTCSTPLMTVDGLWLIIAGCAEGIFVGWRGRPKTMQQVVHLAGITQCAVLTEFSFLLVIANKVLVAYALEALIPSSTGTKLDQASKAPQRLSGQKDVSFFKVGKIGGEADSRTLVIYAKKSGVKESVFKALEPVGQDERKRTGGGGRFLGLGSGRPEWFRTYTEFFMPSLVTGLYFQRSKLALIGSRGIEIMDLDSMRTMTVPDFPASRQDRAALLLAKRCEDASTLGMFRIAESKFLLAYTEFAFHVGRHGEPVEGPFMEWESKPEQVAYCAPYIFAISPTIVEIRHAFTGRLVQFITGAHISLTYDGTAIVSAPPQSHFSPGVGSGSPSSDLVLPPDRRLHLSMRQGTFHVLYEVVIVA
ncbi:Rho guanyl-nucleotide exchange factor [Rhodotorula toruloides]|uniref:BY PROTMAP: gi/472587266/gb/EMS24765.1/ Rho guanyl-nucleotide exchange factor [Rhodosporidium toruloides NP11] gi/647401193/emb/CDR47273.1/ RHTO0S14e01354g1_1 [Rhodosporidium toruloides] n=1 Tax=Rhodotorula toruloides TaxID=5286 RepID=A0A0K3CAF9_RHOTO|nr:Rho guanyl-nucleotide exchange factor [Rhodotorula toruloides]PRQ77124.1 CNH domain-domain containing protein [Rhodotorula toruloides]